MLTTPLGGGSPSCQFHLPQPAPARLPSRPTRFSSRLDLTITLSLRHQMWCYHGVPVLGSCNINTAMTQPTTITVIVPGFPQTLISRLILPHLYPTPPITGKCAPLEVAAVSSKRTAMAPSGGGSPSSKQHVFL